MDIDFDELEADSELQSQQAVEFSSLPSLVRQLADLTLEKEGLEEKLDTIGKKITELEQKLIPDQMIAARVKSYTDLDTGRIVELDNIIKANMPSQKDEKYEEKSERAVGWLDKNGLGDIVSRELVVKLGKDSTELSQRLSALIVKETNGICNPVMENAVNFQTLNAVLRKRYRDDEPVPTENDGFAVFIGNVAKLKKPKKGK